MNGRIQELAREAGFEHPDHVGSCEIYAYFDHEKFAELIVKECISICDKEYVAQIGTSASAYNSAIKKCRDNIAQHFGVDK